MSETMHLETGRFELVSAMDRCLKMEDAPSAWTRGCTVFIRSGTESREETEKTAEKEEGGNILSHAGPCFGPFSKGIYLSKFYPQLFLEL